MRLAEFLSQVLATHGEVLLRLAALIGEEELLELLEKAEELHPTDGPYPDDDPEGLKEFARWELWLKERLVASPGESAPQGRDPVECQWA